MSAPPPDHFTLYEAGKEIGKVWLYPWDTFSAGTLLMLHGVRYQVEHIVWPAPAMVPGSPWLVESSVPMPPVGDIHVRPYLTTDPEPEEIRCDLPLPFWVAAKS